MRKPPQFWEKTFGRLGFVRVKGKKAGRSRPRATRSMQIEPLEPRQLLSGAQPMSPHPPPPSPVTLYWDPGGTKTETAGNSSNQILDTWNTTSSQWYNPQTNSDQAWSNVSSSTGAIAVFEGTGGTVTVSGTISYLAGISISSNSGPSYTINSGTLSDLSGTTLAVTVSGSQTIGSILSGSSGLTVSGGGTLILNGNACAGTNDHQRRQHAAGGRNGVVQQRQHHGQRRPVL